MYQKEIIKLNLMQVKAVIELRTTWSALFAKIKTILVILIWKFYPVTLS